MDNYINDKDQANNVNKRKINLSMLLGIVSAIMIFLGMHINFFSFTFGKRNFIWNFGELCKRAGIFSDLWRGLPAGMYICVFMMLACSFFKTPIIKLFPFFIGFIILIIMLIDSLKTLKSVIEDITGDTLVVNFRFIIEKTFRIAFSFKIIA